jgi:hypothetical protein
MSLDVYSHLMPAGEVPVERITALIAERDVNLMDV